MEGKMVHNIYLRKSVKDYNILEKILYRLFRKQPDTKYYGWIDADKLYGVHNYDIMQLIKTANIGSGYSEICEVLMNIPVSSQEYLKSDYEIKIFKLSKDGVDEYIVLRDFEAKEEQLYDIK